MKLHQVNGQISNYRVNEKQFIRLPVILTLHARVHDDVKQERVSTQLT